MSEWGDKGQAFDGSICESNLIKTSEQVHDSEEFQFVLHLGKDIINPGHVVSNRLGNLVEFVVINDSSGGEVFSIFLWD